ncbi:MAG: Flp family type IVb pilin [Nitrospirales bacterium]
MRNLIKAFVMDEEGATALEYGLLAALIAAVIIGAVQALGNVVSTTFNTIAANMTAAS